MDRIRSLWRREDGQAMVEFAMIFTILLLLLLGIVELGRVGHAYVTVVHASREGARLGAVGKDDSEIETAVRRAAVALGEDYLEISVSPQFTERHRGEPVEVLVNYQVALIVPMITSVLPNPFPVRGATVMRME